MITKQEAQRFRQQLAVERERVLVQQDEARSLNDMGRNPNRADLAVAYGERERRLALNAIDDGYLAQLESALQRLDEGTFGLCVSCGEPVAYGRLEIMPHAAYCVSCQREREATNQG